MTAFAALLAKRFEENYILTDVVRSSTDLGNVVTAIDRGELKPHDIGCQSPEWVAARLWDQHLTDTADYPVLLRLWVDHWQLLGYPSLIPGRAWNEAAASAFHEAALGVIEAEPSLVSWEEARVGIIKQIALVNQQSPSNVENYVPTVPATLVDRSLWFDSHSLERASMEIIQENDHIFGLVRLLLNDVEAADHSQPPHQIVGRLIALSIERPALFLTLLFRFRGTSVLLADLLLNPATSALACLLVAQWQSLPSAWDRELRTRDDQTTKAIAFSDAVSVMGEFLKQGSLPPAEAASLMNWMHLKVQPGFVDDLSKSEAMLATLRNELAGQSKETLLTMVAALTASMPKSGLGTSAFATALDIVDSGNLAADIDPIPLVTAYIDSVVASDYSLSANRVSVSGAVSLLELVMRAPSELRQKFFSPIDSKARLAAAVAADENPYTVTDTIASSIRAHIRVLSRAIAGSANNTSAELANALIAAVRAGALKHDEKGRVAAFAAQHESDIYRGSRDRPIAADLGAALTALTEPQRQQLLSAILETDEPMMLAQLLSFVPYTMRGQIEGRVAELTPSESGEIHSLTEVQARIEALLSAGLADSAALFVEAERNLKTLGNVAGREATHLRATLRLQLLRGEWAAIAKTEPPPSLSPAEKSSTAETITFYKALAALNNPNGDQQTAERMFVQLQSRHPDVAAYSINLFAARISLLLGGDLFVQLRDTELIQGRQVLIEAEQMMFQARVVSDSDAEIFNCNKAVLLLALGQPDQAHDVLRSLPPIRLNDRVAAYSAVALARTGRTSEAMAVLKQAEQALGNTDVLRAAGAHVQNGTPFSYSANISAGDDPLPRIKEALWDLSQMDPVRQAEVFQRPPEPFDSFVISHVRSAAESLTSLVPMMADGEDNTSALFRELLVARLLPVGWSVPDQPKGGFSAKGNAGERDLLLQKDGTTLAVIEAIVCKNAVSTTNLTSHFQKLFGYSLCRLFFHITYSYVNKASSILEHLKKTAKDDAPSGFKYRASKDIPHTDSRPVGFTSCYDGEFGEVKVVFLILDMAQNIQREAAKTAMNKAPRKKKSV
jgi:tetratricopeptide (TPR) repeat protein